MLILTEAQRGDPNGTPGISCYVKPIVVYTHLRLSLVVGLLIISNIGLIVQIQAIIVQIPPVR